ncbi:allophanate hydrolase [Roseomonas sp. 18066]|uniref:allophanate hydrolase n=1 Tax=Roseomonas sp. 18066 TaxID=2681412 RepID=UPI001359669D|nr:allophanate hydrolase [Roseomonas sp. 18066]
MAAAAPLETLSLDAARLAEAYAAGLAPEALLAEVLRRIEAAGDPAIWINRRPAADILAEAARLPARRAGGDFLPLYGLPFAVKDNLDVAGLPTTAACPDFSHYPAETAAAVAKLTAAGAVLLGKTNLDQFATGLVGVRSPYGVPRNAFDPTMIPGGSSSGSAVVVARGLASFSLGTDTAGSGRIPAAFNNIVGLKPSRGLVSNHGMVPACRSLDCVSVFALTVEDAAAVSGVLAGFDPRDAWSRQAPPGFVTRIPAPQKFRFAIPRAVDRDFLGDAEGEALFQASVARLKALGGEVEEIDFSPFQEVARLLYGPFVAERTHALREWLAERPDSLHPVTHAIIAKGQAYSGLEILDARQRLQALAQAILPIWSRIDVLVVPTAGRGFSLEELAAEPIACNSALGRYTNFTNLLDLSGLAVPGGFDKRGFPAGVTLLAPAFHDGLLAGLGVALQRAADLPLGATGATLPPAPAEPPAAIQPMVEIAVFGAHLDGQPLNPALRGLGGVLRRACRTEPCYRLLALPGTLPRPGLLPARDGVAIDGEVWALPSTALGAFLATIAAPLGLGQVRLEGGPALGFICEGGVEGAVDISAHGGWRAFRAASAAAA